MKSQESETCAAEEELVEDVLEEIVEQIVEVEERDTLDEEKIRAEGETTKQTVSIKDKTDLGGATDSKEVPERTSCEKIKEHPKLICFLVFLVICGIALAICGACGVFKRSPDYAQNLMPKATNSQDLTTSIAKKPENLKETADATQDKEMDLLPLTSDVPNSGCESEWNSHSDESRMEYLTYVPPSRTKSIQKTVYQRNTTTKILFIVSMMLNAFIFGAFATREFDIAIYLGTPYLILLPVVSILSRFPKWLQVVGFLSLFYFAGFLLDYYIMDIIPFIKPRTADIMNVLTGMGAISFLFVISDVLIQWISFLRSPSRKWRQFFFLLLVLVVSFLIASLAFIQVFIYAKGTVNADRDAEFWKNLPELIQKNLHPLVQKNLPILKNPPYLRMYIPEILKTELIYQEKFPSEYNLGTICSSGRDCPKESYNIIYSLFAFIVRSFNDMITSYNEL